MVFICVGLYFWFFWGRVRWIFMRNLHQFFWKFFFFYHWSINSVLQESFQTWSSAPIWNLHAFKSHTYMKPRSMWLMLNSQNIVDVTVVNPFVFYWKFNDRSSHFHRIVQKLSELVYLSISQCPNLKLLVCVVILCFFYT